MLQAKKLNEELKVFAAGSHIEKQIVVFPSDLSLQKLFVKTKMGFSNLFSESWIHSAEIQGKI